MALKYLKGTEVNIGNVLIMTRDFNIRDNSWDILFPYHSVHKNTLIEVIDSLYLDLMFLRLESLECDNNSIYPD